MMAARFIPREIFPHYRAIPRSYFLGHHRSGLKKMKTMLSHIDYVVECRDYRAPVTSINPMFEEALGETRRLIVYTKRDLGGNGSSAQRQVSVMGEVCYPFNCPNYRIETHMFFFYPFHRPRKRSEPSIKTVLCFSSAHPPARICLLSSNIFELMPMDQISLLDAV